MENFMQTLKEAERKWSDNGRLINSNTELENQISDSIQTEGDYSYPNDVLDSWVAANGSDHHSKIGDSSFKGGFAPKCETGQTWQENLIDGERQWGCSGAINWDQEFFFPENIGLNEDGKETVGFFVMPYNFQRNPGIGVSKNTFFEATQSSSSWSESRIQSMSAVCWKGNQVDKPSTFSDSDENESWFAVELSDLDTNVPNRPVPVFGELEMDERGGDFTCEWHYETNDGTVIDEEGGSGEISNAEEFCSTLTNRGYRVNPESSYCSFRGKSISQSNFGNQIQSFKNRNGNSYSRDIDPSGITS